MYLIAIDEAGYGPKLGPLVVAGSVWHCPQRLISTDASVDTLADTGFAVFQPPVEVDGVSIRVDDSKQIFRSRSSGKGGGSLAPLHRIVSVSHHLCKRNELTLGERLPTLIPLDHSTIAAVPWLAALADSQSLAEITTDTIVSGMDCKEAIQAWSRSNWKLLDVRARMIDAGSFNRFFESAKGQKNKSDLLGETSIGLAVDLMESLSKLAPNAKKDEPVQVFFDRHGGRKFYAGPIQQAFGLRVTEAPLIQIRSESAKQSVYELDWNGRSTRLHFTVKGDRFTPVAMSSLHAKYLREVGMAALNHYFKKRFAKTIDPRVSDLEVFRPTAGYPTDADRFLHMIEPVRRAFDISLEDLVRCR